MAARFLLKSFCVQQQIYCHAEFPGEKKTYIGIFRMANSLRKR